MRVRPAACGTVTLGVALPTVIVTERFCEGCDKPLPSLPRPNQRHHGPACRRSPTGADRQRGRRPRSPDTLPGTLIAAAARTWRAAAWLLERQYPERCGLPLQVDRFKPPGPTADAAVVPIDVSL